jgi:hypothetical protein
MEKSMEMRLSYKRQHIVNISIGLFVATGVMIMSQQFEGIMWRHQQEEAVIPEGQEAVQSNVHEQVSAGDKAAVLPNKRESVLPPVARAGDESSIACWDESPGMGGTIIFCATKKSSCLPGWVPVPPSPPRPCDYIF